MTALARATTTSITPAARPARSISLPELIQEFEQAESRHLPDQVVALAALTMTPNGTIKVGAGGGEFDMTPWSRKQLASLVGVRWDRWFAGVDREERAEEVNRRFSRLGGKARLRTALPSDDLVEGDGVLRAFVSPTYTAVKDSLVARSLHHALVGVERDVVVQRRAVTDRSTSYVVQLGQPYKIGGPGNVGDVYGALLLSNSDVGWSVLDVQLHTVRVACLNGLVVVDEEGVIVHKRHRGIDPNEITVTLHEKLRHLPDRLLRGTRRMERSGYVTVSDVDAEVRQLLRDAKLPLKLAPMIMTAYSIEPHASAFGVSQAMTLAAQWLDPEERLALERAAGSYLARVVQ